MNMLNSKIVFFLFLLGLCAAATSLLIAILALLCNIVYMKINDIDEDDIDQIILVAQENFSIKWVFIISLVVYLYKSNIPIFLPV